MSSKKANIGFFAREVLKRPLYPYQEIIGNTILNSVLNSQGLCFTVMMARQMGKNQLSAILEAYILCAFEEGTIVKCAPTYKPQVINSRLRLLTMLENDFTADRVFKSFGYIIGVSPSPQQRRNAVGPRILMFSADEESNVVGATASLLLEVDEAQDVSSQKFDRDFRPMASTTNATTVLYGTAWSDDTLLAMTRAHNLELSNKTASSATSSIHGVNWQASMTITGSSLRLRYRDLVRTTLPSGRNMSCSPSVARGFC